MPQNVKRNVAIGAAALVVLGGGGIAVAASTSSSSTSRADREKAFIEDAAKRLSVTPEALTSALKGAFGDQLDAAVKDGTLTQQQADAITARIAKGGLPLGGPGFGRGGHDGPGGPGRFGGPSGPGGGLRAGADAAAAYLGLTETELRAKLGQGTSLADVAKAQQKDVGGLEDAIVAAAKKQLDAAVADKKLTDAQRDDIEQDLATHVKELVEHDGPPRGGPRGGHRGGGFGGGPHRP